MDTSGSYPTATRTATQWWDASSEPVYGDHGAIDGHDGYIYVLGSYGSLNLYMARVSKSQATNLDSYQYWNGNEFTNDRLHNPTNDQAVFPANSGTPFWSNYYNCWAYISRAWCKYPEPERVGQSQVGANAFAAGDMQGITLRTSNKLTGPWTDEMILFEAEGISTGDMVYAPTVHTHYDTSGKSLVVTYTAQPNQQMAARVVSARRLDHNYSEFANHLINTFI